MRINLFLLKVMLICPCLSFISSACAIAQLSKTDLLHDFYDRGGVPITAGQVVNLNDKEVTVLDGYQSRIAISISQLSKRDKDYIRWLKKRKLKDEQARERANDLAKELEKGSTKLIVRRLNELADLGNFTPYIANQVLQLSTHAKDNEIRIAAFFCYLAICPSDKDTFDDVINILRQDKYIHLKSKADPAVFLNHISKFGSIAEPILIHTAFTGEVDFDYSNLILPNKPKIFATVSGAQNDKRAAALISLSRINSTRAQKAKWDVIQAAENKLNGQFDQKTIRSLLASWGNPSNGCPNRSVLEHAAFGNKYEKIFPREVEAWSANSRRATANAQRVSKITKMSKMRNFYDRNGRFITRGNFVNMDQGKVIIKSYRDETILWIWTDLSNKDQSWIETK